MAKPATTHVIEIESGIGEPAFIPLTLGQELQPISVGKKGMWRVEGARVLDVHAFVYFDGNALFLQSADEASAALVDGYRVGKAWTELHAPCRIEVGAARLRFRSLIGDASNAATVAADAPPVKAPPGGPGGGGPTPGTIPGGHNAPGHHSPSPSGGHSAPPPRAAPPPQRPAAGAPPEPMTFPKPERPFAPGALSAQRDDESTRIAPLESTGTGAIARGASGAINAAPREPPREPPRPAAGRPVEEDLSTRPEAARAAKPATGQVQAIGSGGYPAQHMGNQPPMVQGVMPVSMAPGGGMGMQPGMQGMQQGMQPNMQPGMQMQGMPSGSMPPAGGYGYPQQPGGYPQQQQGYGQQGPMPGQSGAYGAMPSGGMQTGGLSGPSMAPNGYGSQTPQPGGEQKSEGLTPMSEVLKDPKQRIKLLAVGIILLGGVYLLLLDDDPPPPRRVAIADAGLVADGGTMAGSSGGAITPPPAPCPPGFQPYGEVRPGQPTTCVPMAAGGSSSGDPGSSGATASGGVIATGHDSGAGTGTSSGGSAGNPPATPDAGARPKLGSSQKTLERQAVDYVAIGEYQKAIGIYEQLSRQFPDNKVYSEALRILRQKLDAGAGGNGQ